MPGQVSAGPPERVRRRMQPLPAFARRAVAFAAFGLGGIGASLVVGAIGYRVAAGLDWVDAFLNAAMILSGMGPVDRMQTDGAKLFSGTYALLGGLAWSALVGIILYPFVHRMLRALHLQVLDERDDD